ncbi:KAP family P-loop NTPase fold protein [Parvimonas sp. D9]|uniref:KAP family P-loop NTPase fold protein n=1 Tax=Parvimonas sp. D9 TaxID=3110689 RepID=UPI002B46B272|nr:P-loop NTPase fold protein [Parvimonas sp. D9]MEB3059164.1 P-loop NTPase fold protein [Parvimonas sp. D9]
MDKEKKYFKEIRKKVDIYFVIIISIVTSTIYYAFEDFFYKNSDKFEIFLFTILSCLFIYLLSIRKDLKSKNITEFDKIITTITIFSIILFTFLILIELLKNGILSPLLPIKLKTIILLIFSVFFIILIYRLYSYKKSISLKENSKNNEKLINSKENSKKVYTLRDIYMGNFNISYYNKIQIMDSNKIEEDLFERKDIVYNLCYSIATSVNYPDSFTIGVVGEWGSGKSTIIELAKTTLLENFVYREDVNIIDDFDPWTIKSQDSLILAMYNIIMDALEENISYFKRKKVQNALINISTNIPYIGKGIGNFFENRIDEYTEYKEIKADLEEKLEKSKNHLIFIIDNLDRMNSDNVLFLLTLIGTLFKLPNITYIVAYDKKRLKSIFRTDKIDPKYLEKIINKEIVVPKIHNFDKQQIFYNCLKNCIEDIYNINNKTFFVIPESINNYNLEVVNNKTIEKVASKFDNIRDFIRFLNIIIYDINDVSLNKLDFLIIKLIEYFDYELYFKIYKNKNFITTEKENIECCTKEEIKFFKETKKSNFFDLLQLLSFQSTNFYNLEKEPQKKYPIYNINSKFLKHSICNKDIFEDYFSHNFYTEEYKEIIQFFKNISNTDYNSIEDFFNVNNKYLERNYIHSLYIYLSKIKLKNDENTKYFKMRLFIYFIDKTDIYLYDNDKGNNKNIIIFFLGELYRTIIGLDKDTIVSEENISSSIKQFLKDIEFCFNTSIYEKTMVNLEKLVNTKYNVYNEDFKKMIKIALEEIKNDKINNK